METLINTDENISDIALAYYDDVDEVLKEVKGENLYFSLSPFSSQYKRLYLIGDLIYKDIVRVTANISEGFEVKLASLSSFNYLSDFEDKTNELYCVLDNKHLNSIPLDVLVTSNSIAYNTVFLDIVLEVRGVGD